MQHVVSLGAGKTIQLYYNKNVYSPEYSSISTILLADKLIKDGKKPNATLCDVGCGTGMIGLGVKKLNPTIQLTLCDIDNAAVRVSKLNAKRLGLPATVLQSDMLPTGSSAGRWDIITANLPTFTQLDMPLALHGPEVAYYSGEPEEPLTLYEKLFNEAKGRCKALVCECQTKYQEPFLQMAEKAGWKLVLSSDMAFAFISKR